MSKLTLTAILLGISSITFAQADSSSFYLQKGMDEKSKGRRQESLKQFEKAYSFNKTDKVLVSELAAAYLDLRRYAQAKEQFLHLEQMGDHSDSTYRQLMLLNYNTRQLMR
jgi:tetratricopeptide (TPR) repeat protein